MAALRQFVGAEPLLDQRTVWEAEEEGQVESLMHREIAQF